MSELQLLKCDLALDSVPSIIDAYKNIQKKTYVQVLFNGNANNVSPVIGKGSYGLRIRLNFHTSLFDGNMTQIEYSFNTLRTDEQFKRLLNLQWILFEYAISCSKRINPMKPSR